MENCVGRNKAIGFACRVKKNLSFILEQRKQGKDVHEVTQIILSLLGLVVFPWEREHKVVSDKAKNLSLNTLVSEGWPRWEFLRGSSNNLFDLIRRLRNAVAHANIWFSSDDREAKKVKITFKDRKPKKHEYDWEVSIDAEKLKDFCEKFIDLVYKTK